MSGKKKAKSQLTTPISPTMNNNWILTGVMDADLVEKLCLTIFDSNRNLNTDFFEYGIVRTRSSLDGFNVFGYIQIRNYRWGKQDLLHHLVVTLTSCSTNGVVFGVK